MERAISAAGIHALGSDDRPFQDGLFRLPEGPGGTPRLIGQKCLACGAILYPPSKDICPSCRQSGQLEETLLGPRGRLFTFSVVRVGTPQYAKNTPYAVGYVDLEEGVRVFAQLKVADFRELAVGLEMELVVDELYTDDENRHVIGYKFRPIALKGGRQNHAGR